jgi:hypothetical protein
MTRNGAPRALTGAADADAADIETPSYYIFEL